MNEKGDILFIEWVDSVSDSGWKETRDCVCLILKINSVGFFVDETDEVVCIALSRATEEDFRPFGDLLSIPKCSIVKRWKLKNE